MKNNKKLLILIIMLLCLTGCTQRLTTETKKNGKTVKENVIYSIGENATGQILTKNILCKPNDKNLITLYEKNKVDIKALEECKKIKLTFQENEGLWSNLFVRPLAWLIIRIGLFVNNYGFAVILTSILIRLLLFPVTKKSLKQSDNMKKAKPELNILEKKYIDKKDDQQAMMQKSQEMMAIYKKHNISLFSGCILAFIQLPLFIAFLEAINRVPAIFEGSFLGFQLGTTPRFAIIEQGQYYYLILIFLILITTYFSFKLSGATGDSSEEDQAAQTTQTMMKIMIVVIGISSFSLSTAIGIYWISSSLFTIVQGVLVKRSNKNEIKKI